MLHLFRIFKHKKRRQSPPPPGAGRQNFTVSKFYHIQAPISTGFAVIMDYIFPMGIIYLDELFALNLGIDYFLLLGTAKVCALPFRRVRFALAAALGALWCCLGLLPGLSWLHGALCKPLLALAMTLLAFGTEKRPWRPLGVFAGLSAMFGGAVFAAGLWRGQWSPAGPVVRLDLRILVLSFALCWAGVSFLFRRRASAASRELHTLTVTHRGRSVCLQALRDTGNELFDPLSGRPVLIAESRALEPLFPSAAELLGRDPVEAVQKLPGLRLIPYRVLGGGGLLAVFRPEKLELDGRTLTAPLLGLSPTALSDDGSYQALIGQEVT